MIAEGLLCAVCQGKPIERSEDSSDIALKLLKNANMSPEWVEMGKEIRLSIARFRSTLREKTKAALPEAVASSTTGTTADRTDSMLEALRVSPGWGATREELHQAITAINTSITRHNSASPSQVVHLIHLGLDAELKAAVAQLAQQG